MKKRVNLRKQSKKHSPLKNFERNLAHNLIQQERIQTTIKRAKQASRVVDKIITTAKKKREPNLTRALRKMLPMESVQKVKTELVPRYHEREGGYTRILKLEPRRSDGAEMAVVELIQPEE